MRLESALYTSRSGLNAQGQAISVVGDNIANANTVGYRRSRIEFADIVADGKNSETLETLSGGNGVSVAEVRPIHETGILEQTGRQLDVGIGGEGFFIVNDGERDLYTRAGNFSFDNEGFLTDADSNRVQGYQTATSTELSDINLLGLAAGGTETTETTASGNLDSNQAVKPLPTTLTTFDDLTESANFSSVMEVYDSLGDRHEVYVTFFKNEANSWTARAYIDGEDLGGTRGQPVQIGTDATLSFTTSGIIEEANRAQATITASGINYSNGSTAGNFTIGLGSFSQLATTSIVNSNTNNGEAAGQISGYEIAKDGKVYAILDSGSTELMGIIGLADFPNLDGLQRAGRSAFVEGADVGERIEGQPGTAGFGRLDAGSLERSTVDIAEQFVDLVLYQRAYQANSQTLNAANGMIRDTLALIR